MSVLMSNLVNQTHSATLETQEELRKAYLGVVQAIRNTLSNNYNQMHELNHTLFSEEVFAQNYQRCEEELTELIAKEISQFHELKLAAYLTTQDKVTFDSEFNKVEGFKKIKKPKELEEQISKMEATLLEEGHSGAEPSKMDMGRIAEMTVDLRVTKKLTSPTEFLGEKASKHGVFLLKKIQAEEGEKFVSSSSCAMVDRVLLAGRMYVTSHRLAFHSKFNSKNVFFGETFIQVPKGDISKVEKRSSTMLTDNGMAVTTVNGGMTFISIFNRDAFLDLIQRTFQLSSDEVIYEEKESSESDEEEVMIQCPDDMVETTSLARVERLTSQLQEFKYTKIYDCEFELLGLNLVKFLRWFELDVEITMNRTPFSSFTSYVKDFQENKDINVPPW